ncbi:serine hydrolase domain-containing protein [Streptomyces sp. 4N509B]|uniref:serine hydrolase domain-containing protein n=1 Tax=Streptomyces sp. 4N509B TaxID=3457413 RepID=UPI003FD2B49D
MIDDRNGTVATTDSPGEPRPGSRRRARRRVAATVTAAGCAALLCLTGPAAVAGEPRHAGAAGAAGDGSTGLQRDVDALHRAGAVGATAVLLTPDGTVAAGSGTADLATGAPADPGARFRAGSTLKPFVATVVLQLVGEGELSLDDTVEEWLPGVVTGNDNDGGRVTVRQLLQHTSGVPDYFAPDLLPAVYSAAGFHANRLRHYADEELVAGAMRFPPDFDPDAEWSYSNTNYILAGMIIERVTGHSWEREVRDRVIVPLGLTDTELPGDDPTMTAPFLRGYHTYAEDGRRVDTTVDTRVDTTVFNTTAASAGGALVSTPRDLNRFLSALLGGELLEPAELAEMLTVRELPGEPGARGYGLGLERRELSCGGFSWHHSGLALGYYGENGVTADGGRAVTVVTNSVDAADEAGQDRREAAMVDLVDRALCAGSR